MDGESWFVGFLVGVGVGALIEFWIMRALALKYFVRKGSG